MTNFHDKKNISFKLTVFFVAIQFAFFASVANASISTELNTILNLSTEVINLNITGAVEEIPADIPPDLRREVLLKIETNPAVQIALEGGEEILGVRTASANVEKAKNDYDSAVALGGVATDEIDALKVAKEALALAANELGKALVSARNIQNDLVLLYQKESRLSNLVGNTVTSLTSKTEKVQTSFTEQAEIGSAQSTVGTISQRQIDAAGVARRNATWDTREGDALATTMQEACSFGFPEWLGGTGGAMNLTPCFAGIVYKLVYIPVSQVLRGSGMIFDKILMLSIEGDLVAPANIINSTWTVVRDFSNMLFIFILLYTGIMTMFGAANWGKVVRNIVIIALLINFSLFFTKVVIDAGNVLAVGLRGAMNTTSVSAGLVGSFAPQRFLKIAADASGADITGGTAIVVFIISSVVSGFAAYVFFKAALLFMGRLIAFWGLMIISPFAFISIAMPKGNIFNKWLDTLLKQAFVAPVFLFFIYIIMKVISAGDGIMSHFSKTGASSDWFESLIGPVIVATLLIIALQRALAIATDMSEDFGKLGSDLISKPLGLAGTVALGATTGGAALVARSTIGRAAQGLTESGALSRRATSNNAFGRFVGRQAITLADKARTGTWDVTGTKIGKATIGKGAAAFGARLEGPGAGAKGGFKGAMERQEDADLKFAKKLEVTDAEKENIKREAEEKIPSATNAVAHSKTKADEATKKMVDAQSSLDSAKLMGTLDPNLEKLLEVAKREEAEAKEALKKDENTLEELKNTDNLIKKKNEDRRDSYAKYVEGRVNIHSVAGGVGAVAGAVATGGIAGAAAGAAIGFGSYSHPQAKKTAEKVRAGKTAKSETDYAKTAKKLAEELETAKKEGADNKVIEHIEKKIEKHSESEGK